MAVTDRFKDLEWFPLITTYCVVGGAGGISSWLSLLLARANFHPYVYDFDTIEEHNLGGQFYDMNSIGKKKVSALYEGIKSYTHKRISVNDKVFTEKSEGHLIMFSGFDNMQARKDMFTVWKRYLSNLSDGYKKEAIFIDGRLQAERYQIMCVIGNDSKGIRDYEEKYLFEDSEVAEEACTMKQTSHTAAIIAGMMVSFFTNFRANLATGTPFRLVPHYYEMYLPLTLATLEV